MTEQQDVIARFIRWALWAIGIGVVLYVVGSVAAGVSRVGDELWRFRWGLYGPILALTLVNYALRWVKWRYLLGQLGVRLPWQEDALVYTAGLAMVISPGKAGEFIKPYFVSRRTGVNLTTTVPALVAERLTDGVAMLALAAFSVGRYASDKVHWIAVPSVLLALLLLVLASEPLSMGILDGVQRLPGLRRVADRVRELLLAMRLCLSPRALVWTSALSMVAWFAECVGYWLVFRGLDAPGSLEAATFLYAFATVAGGAMPGGLGVADGALAAGAVTLLGHSEAVAVTGALLVRTATLWFGVLLGAVALFFVERLLREQGPTPGSPAGGEPGPPGSAR